MPEDTKMVPIEKIFNHFYAAWSHSSYDWTNLLCILANQTELSYSPFGLAHGNGLKSTMLTAKSKIFSSEMLASGFY